MSLSYVRTENPRRNADPIRHCASAFDVNTDRPAAR
jgi:hypothetical protein